jgi:dGTPase
VKPALAMRNRFYNQFDQETWGGPRYSGYRTQFQQDRDRVIHNSAFRRLQAKTQVFLTGEYDFYRTRLTHSLEVAQIARSICGFLKHASKELSDDFHIDTALVEAIGLSHDLGHPPFGHSGERELNDLMRKYGGFEGNAQTLRILTDLVYSDGVTRSGTAKRSGMQPTRALMDGVMKYKTLHSDTPDAPNHFLYEDQVNCRDFIFGGQSIPAAFTPGDALNELKSIECQIMDWADDTAYCLNDIVDGVHAGFIDKVTIERWAASSNLNRTESRIVERLLNTMTKGVLTRDFSVKIGRFVEACQLRQRDTFMSDKTARYVYELVINDPHVRAERKLYKKLAGDVVFRSAQLHQLEFKGKHMLRLLFSTFEQNYLTGPSVLMLLPREIDALVKEAGSVGARARIVCDQIAGMTDDFATRIYRRFFDPDYGSIFDLV